MTADQKQQLMALCHRVFTPSAPVHRLTLFAGRLGEIRKISEAISTRGRHAILYGNRGVGKTSLASVLPDLFKQVPGMRIVKVNCDESDDFPNVWRKGLREIPEIQEIAQINENDDETSDIRTIVHEVTLADKMSDFDHVGPGEIRFILKSATQSDYELVIVFDEFDRLAAAERALFANTIKDLSDNSVDATLVLVGLGRDVEDLIAEHASIDRCLVQILMPPMSRPELKEILSKAMKSLAGMTMEAAAEDLIVALSQGLPHYTHLLGQEATLSAIARDKPNVQRSDVGVAIKEALEKTQHTTRNDYYKASHGQRKGTLFPQVLLACALAEVDELGSFSSGAVRDPLNRITDKNYGIPNYAQHLDKFSADAERGPVLEKWGKGRRFRYRFRNPLLRPFIIMKGLADKLISGQLLEELNKNEPVVAKPPSGLTLFDDF